MWGARETMASSSVLLGLLLSIPHTAPALNIMLTNDDGFEASTIHALYRVLKAEGHSVFISSETQDNSGKGGAADFFKPLKSLGSDTRSGFVKAGSSGVGVLPGDEDVHYVDGSPVAAALYGIDIVAIKKWGRPPDLVISGPNYGNNTGLVNNSSGTVNAALISINRGVSAIAVSTANPSVYKSFDKLSTGGAEYEVAALVVRLVDTLSFASRKGRARLLPVGLGLNVNIPWFASGSAVKLPFKISHVGTASAVVPIFVEDLSQDAGARRFGVLAPALPGVSVAQETGPLDPTSEQGIVSAGAIAVSVIQGNHEAKEKSALPVQRALGPLLARPAGVAAGTRGSR